MCTLSIAVVMIEIHCAKCSVPFAITQEFRDFRLADGDAFYCPNGHVQYYDTKKRKEEARESQRRDIQAIHNAEQAEARAAEGKASDPTTFERITNSRKFPCPCCSKSYSLPSWLRRHVHRQHLGDPKAAGWAAV